MNYTRPTAAFALAAMFTLAAPPTLTAFADDSGVSADNSKANQADAHRSASADSQKNDASDISLTRRIRRSVMADKGLSTYAHNVKIVAVDGTVTLNGAVRTEAERTSIHAKAVSIAGDDHIVDQMTVARPK